MSWIDYCLKQRADVFRRSVLIEQAATGIFEELWAAITPWVEEAKTKGIPVFTNGTILCANR